MNFVCEQLAHVTLSGQLINAPIIPILDNADVSLPSLVLPVQNVNKATGALVKMIKLVAKVRTLFHEKNDKFYNI